ncbi:hypothetical protein ABZP36_018511 [Zizania latifolia]
MPSYTTKFDKVMLDDVVVHVSDLRDVELDPTVKEAFDVAYDHIYVFHVSQKLYEKTVDNMKGVRCKRIPRCIGSVGLYVQVTLWYYLQPQLSLSLTPAQIAGCKTTILATPPRCDGSICKVLHWTLFTVLRKLGVTHILKAGGAQQWHGGTASCPKVEKIFGPGNQYATAAKMILQNSEATGSIDMPAGLSEVLVIADKYENPVHVAVDLISQDAEQWEELIENAGRHISQLLSCRLAVRRT